VRRCCGSIRAAWAGKKPKNPALNERILFTTPPVAVSDGAGLGRVGIVEVVDVKRS
jgi:hypothetical protein